MRITELTMVIVLGMLCMACQGGEKSSRQLHTNSTTKENSTFNVSENNNLPYVIAKGYFVNNTIQNVYNAKITSQKEFEELFGMAATMGKDGMPTKIDFSKQYVIAVVKPKTDRATNIVPISLIKNNRLVEFTYNVEVGEKQTYTIRPCLILIVDKTNDGDVVLKEES